jgi:hypothetical protein
MASACMGRCMEHVSEWVQPRCRSGRRASGSASAPWGAMHVHRQLCRLLGVRAAPRSHSATRLTTLPPRAYWRQERGAPSGLHHAPIRRQCRRTSGTGAGGNSGLLSTSLAFIGIRPVRAEAATATRISSPSPKGSFPQPGRQPGGHRGGQCPQLSSSHRITRTIGRRKALSAGRDSHSAQFRRDYRLQRRADPRRYFLAWRSSAFHAGHHDRLLTPIDYCRHRAPAPLCPGCPATPAFFT